MVIDGNVFEPVIEPVIKTAVGTVIEMPFPPLKEGEIVLIENICINNMDGGATDFTYILRHSGFDFNLGYVSGKAALLPYSYPFKIWLNSVTSLIVQASLIAAGERIRVIFMGRKYGMSDYLPKPLKTP